MQQLINNWSLEQKRISAEEYCLGSLIKDLKNIQPDLIVEIDDGTFPSSPIFHSWRGSYYELGMEFSNNNENITVNDLLEKAELVNGKYLFGYKGGEFLMDLETPIHIANYGSCGNTKLIGVYEDNGKAILKTRIEDE
jgi:hypothetical protein